MYATIIGGSYHKYHFCRDKCFVETNTCLTKQVFCRDKHVFDKTGVLSRHKYACRDKTYVTTNIYHWRELPQVSLLSLAATKHLSRKNYCLSRQTRVCPHQRFAGTSFTKRQEKRRKKTCFVATKMILVASPANDTRQRQRTVCT